jgi:glycerophosphoryl diester phosphodiesterase
MTSFPQLDGFRGGPGLVRLVGHRGARGVMPENTMEGFAFTLAAGVRALEFDVVLTRDRVPVVTHNHRLSRATTRDAEGRWIEGEEPRIADLSFENLRRFDVGGLDAASAYGRRFADQVFLSQVQVPSLSNLLALANAPGNEDVHLLLELKSDPALKGDADERVILVDRVVGEVRLHGLGLRTVLHSFDWDLLDECRRQAPEMPTSYLSQLPAAEEEPGEADSASVGPDFSASDQSIPRMVAAAGGQMWCPHHQDTTPELVEEAHGLGLLVTVWTANEPEEIERMIDIGVDGIVTDFPGRAQHILLERRGRW